MKNYLFIILFFVAFQAFGQQIEIGTGYYYFHIPQWNKAIRTYNESRPFLENTQPLLRHGVGIQADFFGKKRKQAIKHGFFLHYQYAQSGVSEENFNAILLAHWVNTGYGLQWDKGTKKNKLVFTSRLGILGGGLFRRIDGEPLEDEEDTFNAWGIGMNFHIKTAYKIHIYKKHALAPFFAWVYTPYFYAPAAESVLNQTQQLVSKQAHTSMQTLQMGVQWSWGE